MNEIQEKPIVEEKPVVKGLQIKEKLFDQIKTCSLEERSVLIKDHLYAWVEFTPKGSMFRNHWLIFLTNDRLLKTGLFSDEEWQEAIRRSPQLYIN